MKYTELERLAHELCDNLPENKAEGWNWWNIDGDARIHWLNEAHDQIVSKAKAEALTEAADHFGETAWVDELEDVTTDVEGVQAFCGYLRDRAQQLKEES